MLARVLSSAVFGIDAYVVEVEVDIAQGLPAFATVGLPEGAVKESKDRVKAAIKNCGYDFPSRRITVNLAPADIKKEGAAFDLPMAIGILAATEVVQKSKLDRLFYPRRALPRRAGQTGQRNPPHCRRRKGCRDQGHPAPQGKLERSGGGKRNRGPSARYPF